MSILAIKQGIKQLIDSQVWVDEWDVKSPINLPKIVDGVYYPSVAAIQAPVSDLETLFEENFKVNSRATFRVDIAWRFNGNAEFHELPINLVENLVEWVNYEAVSNYAEIWEKIYNLSVGVTQFPVMVSRVEDGDKDWVVYGIFEWFINFPSIPIDPNDLGVIQPDKSRRTGFVVTSIGFRTHRELPNDDTIDFEINYEV